MSPEERKKEREKMPFIVATYVYASSLGQRTHSARTKTKSGVPGDLPKKIVDSFPEELATPVSKIFSNMLATYSWPASWKTEYGIPLEKVQNTKSEDNVRIISLTSFFSKTYENFVIKWLMKYVADKIDIKQFGGHY